MIKSNLNFIVGLVTIIIFIIFSIKDDKVVSNYTIAKANFNRIDGINIGSDIRMSGIKIGNVFDIQLEKNKPTIFFNFKKQILIPDDSSISIQTDGLFGEKYIAIEPGGSESILKSGEQLYYTEDALLLEDLLKKIIELGEANFKGEKL